MNRSSLLWEGALAPTLLNSVSPTGTRNPLGMPPPRSSAGPTSAPLFRLPRRCSPAGEMGPPMSDVRAR